MRRTRSRLRRALALANLVIVVAVLSPVATARAQLASNSPVSGGSERQGPSSVPDGGEEPEAGQYGTSADAAAESVERVIESDPPSERIVGGQLAPVGAYPWHVWLNIGPGVASCGGTLISSEWVMTAAHCLRDSLHPGDLIPSELDLVIGRTTLSNGSQGEVRNAMTILVHPSYVSSSDRFDVGLVRLDAPATRRWARLAGAGDPFAPGQAVRAIGHGRTCPNCAASDALLQVDLPIQSDATMQSAYGTAFDPATMIGAGPLSGGQDTCQGDSGGPLFIAGALQPAVVGDTSWGAVCAAPNFPGVYGEVWQGSMRSFVDTNVPRPVNDNFPGQSIAGSTGIVGGSLTNATGQVNEALPGNGLSAADTTVWYSWTAPASGLATINLRDALFDTVLTVWTGNTVNALTHVTSNDEYLESSQSKLTFNATSGTVYRIQVDGYNAAWGPFGLQWAQNPPPNDDCSSAQAISGPTGKVSGSNVRATGEPGEPSSGSVPDVSIWYSWTAPEAGLAVFNTRETLFDTVLGVYTGTCLASLAVVATGNDFGGSPQTKVAFSATSGVTYRVHLDGFNLATGPTVLQWSLNRPANDDFASAATLSASSGTLNGTTVRATGEPGELDHHGGAVADNSVWFSWTPSTSGLARIELTNLAAGFSPGVEVYTGTALNALATRGEGSTLATFDATSGTTYRIAVARQAGPTGTFQIHWGFGSPTGGKAVADFDGNGTTDIAVFRPSNGTWFVRNGVTAGWGISGDIPVPGDYDGNGTTDIAVFRPSNGTWFVRNGVTAGWGISGDIPVPGDYDGNGTTDIAVFRPSNGTWFVRNGVTAGWGISGDIPVPGDYDGNGTTDIAVFRPSNGTWFVRNGVTAGWGISGDIPVPGDYDGNGTTDIAVFRPSNGTWFVRNGVTAAWGISGDIPVPGDYDGNGTTDIAVFRPSNGTWFVRNGVTAAWGANGDIDLVLPASIRLAAFP